MATERMPSCDVGVLAVAMRTPVGVDAIETSSSVRAGVARFGECAWLDAGRQAMVVAKVEDGAQEEIAQRHALGSSACERRLLRLASGPLRELRHAAGSRRPRAFIAIPDRLGDAPTLLTELCGILGPVGGFVPVREGRAGGLSAVAAAARAIRNGEAELAIAGGVDSYIDLRTLAELDRERRLRSDANRDGFIPGEAAAFLLLGMRGAGTPLALLGADGIGHEPGHLGSPEPYRGDGLSGTLARLFEASPATRVRESWSTMNGESHWAKEWGIAGIRHRQRFVDGHALHHPADCLGDTGAASGAVIAGLAALRLSRRPDIGTMLLLASADHGPRTALLMQPVGDPS